MARSHCDGRLESVRLPPGAPVSVRADREAADPPGRRVAAQHAAELVGAEIRVSLSCCLQTFVSQNSFEKQVKTYRPCPTAQPSGIPSQAWQVLCRG